MQNSARSASYTLALGTLLLILLIPSLMYAASCRTLVRGMSGAERT